MHTEILIKGPLRETGGPSSAGHQVHTEILTKGPLREIGGPSSAGRQVLTEISTKGPLRENGGPAVSVSTGKASLCRTENCRTVVLGQGRFLKEVFMLQKRDAMLFDECPCSTPPSRCHALARPPWLRRSHTNADRARRGPIAIRMFLKHRRCRRPAVRPNDSRAHGSRRRPASLFRIPDLPHRLETR